MSAPSPGSEPATRSTDRGRPDGGATGGGGSYSSVPMQTPWENGGGSAVTRMEQYLVLVVGDREWFFRLSIWLEPTNRGVRPSVLVELMNVPTRPFEPLRGAMLFLGMQLQAQLLRELDRAVQTYMGDAGVNTA
ncbi:hypothetical protein K466DRAFT_604220 [Polyporus arcularius HHB13444]|uniref:Uncharacterized protein n=1 Tax=Polyporus arcularius HHB13444 TaxID=1314778 RepID=A0A5C3NWN3_9APHY|nr:hypothetical protein K466DRAFT_604220 [Polyporus arcularius HHB13444]